MEAGRCLVSFIEELREAAVHSSGPALDLAVALALVLALALSLVLPLASALALVFALSGSSSGSASGSGLGFRFVWLFERAEAQICKETTGHCSGLPESL